MRNLTLHRFIAAALVVVMFTFMTAPARALDTEHRQKAEAALAKALDYLRKTQNADGSWTPKPGPAVTALVAAGMFADPSVKPDDPSATKALNYVLSRQKESGGIYDQILENYNTSISLMALGRAPQTQKVTAAINKAHDYLRNLQWADGKTDPSGKPIEPGHPWYGGAGYGGHGRPDLSNTAMMIAGLNDSGLACEDPAYQRAMAFITSLQGTPTNTAFGDQIQPNGGFIYASSTDKEHIGELETKVEPGTTEGPAGKSRLRTYGSMTYAGFMSYLYAQLDRQDPRVMDAYGWIQRNYTLEENPGVGMQGYYYYLHMMSRALTAWGEPALVTADGKQHDWANELIDKLVSLQREDGSWVNDKDRWMEGDPSLVTAYAVLTLQHALQ